MSDKEEKRPIPGTSSSRELRDKSRVNAMLHSQGATSYIDDKTETEDELYEYENGGKGVSDVRKKSSMPPIERGGEISDLDPGSRNDEQMAREMEEIDREMKYLADQEALMMKSQQLQEKRLALQEMRKKVNKLRGMNSHSVSKLGQNSVYKLPSKPVKKTKISSEPKTKGHVESKLTIHSSASGSRSCHINELMSSDSDNEIDINALRKDKKLRKSVKKELKSLGLHCEDLSSASKSPDMSSESTSSSSSDESDDESSSSRKHKKSKGHKSKKNKKKSGIKAKSSDKVKSPQKWPHAYLQFEYVNKQVTFDELDYRMFIAGELEVISEADISKIERNGRISLLKKIVYYSSTYDFKGLKAFYAAWLREIELGKKSWSDDPVQIETAILTKHIRPTKSSQPASKKDSGKPSSDKEKVWFCSLYQRNKCSHKTGHISVFKGEARLCQHICATCWLKDKTKLSHPECSSSCPHNSA